ncbi:TA system toxin CbtA family protein, partial [Escherichia coli]
HVQLHQQKGMISLSPPTICNSASACTRSQLINSIDILRARRATGLMARDNYRTVNNITLGKHPGAKQ